jgi:formate dehydrogenase maturation protein FdhE
MKNGLADPLLDELASVPLRLWAQEQGHAKLHPNCQDCEPELSFGICSI